MYRAWDRPHDETLDPEIHATCSDEAEPWGGVIAVPMLRIEHGIHMPTQLILRQGQERAMALKPGLILRAKPPAAAFRAALHNTKGCVRFAGPRETPDQEKMTAHACIKICTAKRRPDAEKTTTAPPFS